MDSMGMSLRALWNICTASMIYLGSENHCTGNYNYVNS